MVDFEVQGTHVDVRLSCETAYNFYGPGVTGDTVLAGVYETGEVWSDVKGLGDVRARTLAYALCSLGIALATKDWSFWRVGDRKFHLGGASPEAVAQALATAAKQ